MSYARFGPDSDVYVYIDFDDADTDVYVCCGCSLGRGGYTTPSHLEMLGHLVDHKMAGHKVPAHLLAAIRADGLAPKPCPNCDWPTSRDLESQTCETCGSQP